MHEGNGPDGLTDGTGGHNRREILAALAGAGALAGCNSLPGTGSDDDDGGSSGGTACRRPGNDLTGALPSGGSYEVQGEVSEDSDPQQENIERYAFASYRGPNGGNYTMTIAEFSSASAASEATSSSASGDDRVTGHITVGRYAYGIIGPNEDSVRLFAKQSPVLSDNCVASNMSFPASTRDTATREETPGEETTPEEERDDTVDEVRIGMIQPLSGSLQAYGSIALRGFYTYFGYRGADIPSEPREGIERFEVDGTTYEIEVRDSGGDQTEAQQQALDMAGDVSVLAGAASSASALAIANNVANQQGIPYMVGPAASVGITGSSDNCSRAVFRASETVAMDARTGGKFIADRTGIDSVYIYYADYSYGAAIRDNYRRVLENNGVTVAGEQALPPGYSSDWPAQFEAAMGADVDAVIGGFTVATLPAMLGTYLANDYDFRVVGGLGSRLSAAALGATLQGTLDELTAESIRRSGLGPFTTRYHWNQYDNRIAREANEIHRRAYGTNADMFTSGMFTAASALVQAVEQAGSDQPADIVGELRGMRVEDTMKGRGGYQFQEYNNQARSAMTVVDLVPNENRTYWDAPVQPSRPLATYGMDETTRPASLTDCDLR